MTDEEWEVEAEFEAEVGDESEQPVAGGLILCVAVLMTIIVFALGPEIHTLAFNAVIYMCGSLVRMEEIRA